MQTFYQESGRLGKAPEEIEIYEVSLLLHKTPDEVRAMSMRDVRWIRLVKNAQNLAFGPDFG